MQGSLATIGDAMQRATQVVTGGTTTAVPQVVRKQESHPRRQFAPIRKGGGAPHAFNELRDSAHPCLGGMAVIIDDDSYQQSARRMIRIEALRIYFAYIEPLDIPEYDPDVRFGVVGAACDEDGKLKFGGNDHSLGFWSGLMGSRQVCKKCLHTPLTTEELATIALNHPTYAGNPDRFNGFAKEIGETGTFCCGDGTKRVYSRLKAKGKNRRRCDVCSGSDPASRHGYRQSFADSIVGEGFLYGTTPMNDKSLHLTSQSPLAKCCDKLKYGLLSATRFDQQVLPSQLYVTPKPNVVNPLRSAAGVSRIIRGWMNGAFIPNTSLSPVEGVVDTIERHPADNSLVFMVGKNRIMFPHQFEEVADIGKLVKVGDVLAAPKVLTKEQFASLPQDKMEQLIDILTDGACVELQPVSSLEEDGVTTYDYSCGRKKGVVYYPHDLINADQIGAVYVDCASIPLGAVQVWDFSIQGKDLTGKLAFKEQSLRELGDVDVRYDFYASPRRALVEEYRQSEARRREEYLSNPKQPRFQQRSFRSEQGRKPATPTVDKVAQLSDTTPVATTIPVAAAQEQMPVENKAN